MNFCNKLLKNKNTEKVKKEKTDLVYSKLLKNLNISDPNSFSVNDKLVKETFKILDKIYFNNYITDFLVDTYSKISFKASTKLKKTAGFCKWKYYLDQYGNFDYGIYEIQISKPIIDNLFSDKKVTSLKINGIHCHDKLECYINLYQHEIIHLLISIFCVKEGEGMGGHTKTFMNLVFNLFGHTEYKHLLLSGDSVKLEKEIEFNKLNLELGDIIETKEIKGEKWIAEVNALNIKYVRILLHNTKNKGKLWNIGYELINKINKKVKRNLKQTKKTPEEIKKSLKINDTVHVKLKGKIQKGIVVNLGSTRATLKFDDCKKWYIPYSLIII